MAISSLGTGETNGGGIQVEVAFQLMQCLKVKEPVQVLAGRHFVKLPFTPLCVVTSLSGVTQSLTSILKTEFCQQLVLEYTQ